jgi:hypothetical protein
MERPILFNTPMIQSILDGRKTQTRRTGALDEINKNPESWKAGYTGIYWTDNRGRHENAFWVMFINDMTGDRLSIKCPYGFPGHAGNDDPADVLWVRETWNKFEDPITRKDIYLYREKHIRFKRPSAFEWKWKPSIHMPREACRIKLLVKDIRVERLHDISENDAKKEGIVLVPGIGSDINSAWKMSFGVSWQSNYSNWNLNPWVWVIEFEVIIPKK